MLMDIMEHLHMYTIITAVYTNEQYHKGQISLYYLACVSRYFREAIKPTINNIKDAIKLCKLYTPIEVWQSSAPIFDLKPA